MFHTMIKSILIREKLSKLLTNHPIYIFTITFCHTSITKLWTFDNNVHKHNLNLSKIHISSSNEFLRSPKHFNEYLECNNIQTIVINSPIIILLPKSFQTPFNQLKTSTIISMNLRYTCKHKTYIISFHQS